MIFARGNLLSFLLSLCLLIVPMASGAHPPQGFNHHGDAFYSSSARHEGRLAESLRLTHTSRATHFKGVTWGDCRIGYCQLLQRRYDCDIKGRLSSMGPVGQQDVCRTSTRIGNQPQGFLSWAQGGRLGGIKQDI